MHDVVLIVFACIALGAAAFLFVVLTVAVRRFSGSVEQITEVVQKAGRDITEMKDHSVRLLSETTVFIQKSEKTLEKIDDNLLHISKGTEAFEQMANDIRTVQQDLLEKVQGPLADLAGFLSGTISGISGMLKNIFAR